MYYGIIRYLVLQILNTYFAVLPALNPPSARKRVACPDSWIRLNSGGVGKMSAACISRIKLADSVLRTSEPFLTHLSPHYSSSSVGVYNENMASSYGT